MPSITISYRSVKIDIPVDQELREAGQHLADTYTSQLDSTIDNDSDEISAREIKILAGFIEYAATAADHKHPEIASLALGEISRRFCDSGKSNIHTVVHSNSLCDAVLRGFYAAWRPDDASSAPEAGLFSEQNRSMMVFRGSIGFASGGTASLAELRRLVSIYQPLVGEYVEQMSDFLHRESQDQQISHCYPQGFQVAEWVSGNEAATVPSATYVDSEPVVAPLVGLVQLVRFAIVCRVLNLSAEQLAKRIKSLAGHSHGIVVAAAVSMMSGSAQPDQQQLVQASQTALGTLMLGGCLPQMVCPQPPKRSHRGSKDDDEEMENGAGTSTSMLAVGGVARYVADAVVSKYNDFHRLNPAAKVYMAMGNTDTRFVVAGNEAWLAQFVSIVRGKAASASDGDQETIPFMQRKPQVTLKFMPAAAGAFHTPHMADVVGRHTAYARTKGWVFDTASMQTAVVAPDGSCADIRTLANDSGDLTDAIAEFMYTRPVEWAAALDHADITHIVDMGIGSSEAGSPTQFTREIADGRSIGVICADSDDLYAATADRPADWVSQYATRLAGSADADQRLTSRLSEQLLAGLPPVLVGTIGQVTASTDFVAAVANSGFLAELDITGTCNRDELEARVAELVDKQPPGHPIALGGARFSDAATWEWQLSAVAHMRQRQGLPIVGLGIEDGVVPSPAAGDALLAAGLRYVAVRPLTAKQIAQTLDFAAAHESLYVMLQWLGGRSGGRHGLGEFHTEMLAHYAAIRRHKNVLLVAGSGVGCGEDAAGLLSGAWATACGARAPMPFDGVLLRSRMLAAAESPVAGALKELAVAAPGLEAGDIERLHVADEPTAGGVLSIVDHTGATLHVLATRAARLCRDLGDTVFRQPQDRQMALLRARKSEIIERLNADYMRPWFGRTADGAPAELRDMTYAEVVDRLLEFARGPQGDQWVSADTRKLLAMFGYRMASRLQACLVTDDEPIRPSQGHDIVLDELASFKRTLPLMHTQLLTTDDADYFIDLCKRSVRPVPFVPILDEDFGWYMMRGCLDQCSEADVEKLLDGDVQRMLVPMGPVSARQITTVDEPVGEILAGVVGHLQKEIGNANSPAADLSEQGSGNPSWLEALRLSPSIVRGQRLVSNPVAQLLDCSSITNATTELTADDASQTLTVFQDGTPAHSVRYTHADHAIVLEVHRGDLTLTQHYRFSPSTPWAPLHEQTDACDAAVRAHYAALPDASTFEVTAEGVADFCRQCGIDLPGYPPNTDGASDAPLDYLCAMVAQPCALAALAAADDPAVGHGLLNAVLATAAVELAPHGTPIAYRLPRVGDVLSSRARITEVTQNADGDKQATVVVETQCSNRLLATTTLAYAFRGIPLAGGRGFRHVDEPEMLITMATADDVAVLGSKEWFGYTAAAVDAARSIAPGDRLHFRLQSRYELQTTGGPPLARTETTGTISVRHAVHVQEHVADVTYCTTNSHGNPVLAYLQRMADAQPVDYSNPMRLEHGAPPPVCPLVAGEYALTAQPVALVAPGIAAASWPQPPQLPWHWAVAAVRALVERHAADSRPERVLRVAAAGMAPVDAGERLRVTLHHTGMCDGDLVVRACAYRAAANGNNGDPVLECTATVAAPRTMYVFTGQGSQEPGMARDLYATSAVSRGLLDRIDRHMQATYGFSLLHVMWENPAELTVHFGGTCGAKLRAAYMALQMGEGDKALPLFPEITAESRAYTFRAPGAGLLHATQFAQPAIIAFDIAAVADMRAHGLVQKNALLGGHSLGEYGALAAFGIMTPEDIVDVTFVRGMTMQATVVRDACGRSEFAMVAVNPARVAQAFGEGCLAFAVDRLRQHHAGLLLEIVNYNVRGHQYIVAGNKQMLVLLGRLLDRLHAEGLSFSGAGWQARARAMVDAMPLPPADACHELARGRATLPIPGIDVPFHSSHLLSGASYFRQTICRSVRLTDVDNASMQGRYIANLNAQFLRVTRAYFEEVRQQTGSPVLAHELAQWPEAGEGAEDEIADPAERMRLARLMTIEVLAYQFASPVRWIETQERVFEECKVERLVEVGPVATLCRMAEATLRLAGLDKHVRVSHIPRDADELYYVAAKAAAPDGEEDEPGPAESGPAAAEPAPAPAMAAVAAAEPAPAAAAGLPAVAREAADDAPLTALHVVRALVAQKLRLAFTDVQPGATLRELTGGRSTLLNEILGDALREFGIATATAAQQLPERLDEATLADASTALQRCAAEPATGLGRHTSALVARLFSGKMPGGMPLSAARRALADAYGLQRPHQQDAALLVALGMEPAERLASAAAALAWLGDVARAYAAAVGIRLADAGAAAARQTGAAAAVAVAGPEFARSQARLRRLAEQQAQAYADYLRSEAGDPAEDTAAAQVAADAQGDSAAQAQAQLGSLVAELGQDFIDGVQPLFSARKARHYDSSWNWARTDAAAWVAETRAAVDWDSLDTQARLHRLANRADAALVGHLQGICGALAKQPEPEAGEHALALARRIHAVCADAAARPPAYREFARTSQPATEVSTAGRVTHRERSPRPGEPTLAAYIDRVSAAPAQPGHLPLVHMREHVAGRTWAHCEALSQRYYACLREQTADAAGVSYAGCTALVTGCSAGSIGAQLVQALLAGGAYVIATTSAADYARATQYYAALYRTHGARGAALLVLPFNQASVQDVGRLVRHVYVTLGRNLDYVLPFAALAEYTSDVSSLGGRSELVLRLLMTNVLRLLGEIRRVKQAEPGWATRPTLAVLPLSPNHGELGSDGLYGESKAALETLLARWHAEQWGAGVCVAGAVIGWTRGTSLMAANDLAAAPAERCALGGRTFSAAEMAFNIMGLLHPRMAALAERAPLWADLNGGLQRVRDVSGNMRRIRRSLAADASRRAAVAAAYLADFAVLTDHDAQDTLRPHVFDPMANVQQGFARPLASRARLAGLRQRLEGMANLDRVVVVAGYGELGPYGGAATRWEMEAHGEFSLEGCVELAWVMGLIRHGAGGGWADAATGEPVADRDIKRRYEPHILAHTGVRLLEAAHLWDVADPAALPLFRELQITCDLPPFEATESEAAQFRLRNGALVDTWANADGSWSVRFRRGAVLLVPKALRFDRLVGAQLPSGWTPERYGVPPEVARQVDPVTCYAIIATAEALVRAGVTDPYELYAYFHVSQVGTALGSGAGGVHAIRDLYRRRMTDKPVAVDIMQETFANSMAAWINMLLLSSAGPIKPPIGGCATALLSVDVAADTIRQGAARVMVAGGFEGVVDQGSYEFAQMGATCSSEEEAAQGRAPHEMSRPTTSTRAGFVETQGAGVVILMSATAAIEFGAPIYAIVAHTASATDKQSASLPAPGMGLLTTVRQNPEEAGSPLLDLGFRRAQLQRELAFIDAWAASAASAATSAGSAEEDAAQLEAIQQQASVRRRAAQDTWGVDFYRASTQVSPLLGALAAWGLSADDISMASLHGTATQANDLNEAQVVDQQMRQLGRTPGNAVPVVCQKWLTGHPKGPAAAWMLNGAIQAMRCGLVPGNRNADNIDAAFRQRDMLFYPSSTIRPLGGVVKAALLKSYGFGQVGAEMLVVHPDYVLATLSEQQLEEYAARVAVREKKAYRYWQDVYADKHTLFQPKSAPPFTPAKELAVYTDSLARAKYDPATNTYAF
ncbi:fatty acid synthase alpha subunit Lsd1 [Coemansia erecta]|uniref:Fatty acid synthase alpha subunit Lsd1 n=1 Tax=Coemansia erecta TaxID=147472 RepID=A0A9W7Y3G4_9FUNG|nr:fatty acid synthase alpha subunit Lsd1 [Coemansia erecta]